MNGENKYENRCWFSPWLFNDEIQKNLINEKLTSDNSLSYIVRTCVNWKYAPVRVTHIRQLDGHISMTRLLHQLKHHCRKKTKQYEYSIKWIPRASLWLTCTTVRVHPFRFVVTIFAQQRLIHWAIFQRLWRIEMKQLLIYSDVIE